VNFHATWTVHPLTADEPGRVSFVADAPEDLLAQGMLAFLAAVLPERLPDSPGLAALLTTDEAGVRRIARLGRRQADAVAALFGRCAQAAVTTLDACCVTAEQIAAAQAAGVRLQVADAGAAA
jgi:hypothetical protein